MGRCVCPCPPHPTSQLLGLSCLERVHRAEGTEWLLCQSGLGIQAPGAKLCGHSGRGDPWEGGWKLTEDRELLGTQSDVNVNSKKPVSTVTRSPPCCKFSSGFLLSGRDEGSLLTVRTVSGSLSPRRLLPEAPWWPGIVPRLPRPRALSIPSPAAGAPRCKTACASQVREMIFQREGQKIQFTDVS